MDIDNLQKYLQDKFQGCDIIPLRKNTKQVKYTHKNGTWNSQKATAHIKECHEGGAAILLNEKLIVVDVDDVEWIQKIESLCPEFKHTVQTQTIKGKHYYFNRGNHPTPQYGGIRDSARQLVDENGHVIPIDIKTITLSTGDKFHKNQEFTRSVIVIPPTPGKNWIIPLGINDPSLIPQSFIDFYYETFKGRTVNALSSNSSCGPSTISVADYRNDKMSSSVSINEKDIIPLLVNILSIERAMHYPQWMEVGWALKNLGEEYFDTWNEFSKRCSDKYNAEEVRSIWYNMDNNNNNGFKVGSIYYWAKQDDRIEYIKLMNHLCKYNLINLDDLRENIKYKYYVVKAVFEKYVCGLLQGSPITYIDRSNDIIEIRTVHDIRTKFSWITFFDTLDSKQPNKKFIGKWLDDPKMKTYATIGFYPPPQNIPNNHYNEWTGIEPRYLNETQVSDIEPFINHIKLLVDYDDYAARYFIEWLAHMFQYPGHKLGICIVIISKQGVGKSIFYDFIKSLLGDKYCYKTSDAAKILGKFNASRKNNILTCFEEIKFGEMKEYTDKFKEYITSSICDFEQKGRDNKEINDFSRYLCFSNNDSPVKIERSDRRFVVFKASDTMRTNSEYYNNLVKFFNSEQGKASVLNYLLNYELTTLNNKVWEEMRPITNIYNDIRSLSTPPIIMFTEDLYENNKDQLYTNYSIKDLVNMYNTWIEYDNMHLNKTSTRLFARMFKNYFDTCCEDIRIGKNSDKGLKVNMVMLKALLEKL
jgi:hypothetical protein